MIQRNSQICKINIRYNINYITCIVFILQLKNVVLKSSIPGSEDNVYDIEEGDLEFAEALEKESLR